MENIQEKNERRVQQGKKQHPQRLNRNSLLVQTACRQIWGGWIIYKKMDAGGEMNSMKQDYNCGIRGERRWRGIGRSPLNEFVHNSVMTKWELSYSLSAHLPVMTNTWCETVIHVFQVLQPPRGTSWEPLITGHGLLPRKAKWTLSDGAINTEGNFNGGKIRGSSFPPQHVSCMRCVTVC